MQIAEQELIDLIISTIQEQVPSAKADANTPLIGTGRIVDSIGLVTLLVAIEDNLAGQFGKPVSLMDDRAMSQSKSPFRTVGTLASYLLTVVNDQPAENS